MPGDRIPVPPSHPGIILISEDHDEPQERQPQRNQRNQRREVPNRPTMMRGGNSGGNIPNTTMYSDITPKPVQDDKYYRKQLTLYEDWTVKPSFTEEKKKEEKRSKSTRRSSSVWGHPREKKEKPQKWAKVGFTQGSLSNEAIIKRVKELEERKEIGERAATLFPNQKVQVDNLLRNKNANETMPEMEWVLAQFERKTRPISNSRSGKSETIAMTLYLKRTPKFDVNLKEFHKHLKANNLPLMPASQGNRLEISGPDGHSDQMHMHQFDNGPRPSAGPAPRRRQGNGGPRGGGDPNDIITIVDDGPQRRPRSRAPPGRGGSPVAVRVRSQSGPRRRNSRSRSRMPERNQSGDRNRDRRQSRRPSIRSRRRRSRSQDSSSSDSNSDSGSDRSGHTHSTLPSSHSSDSNTRGRRRESSRYINQRKPSRYHSRGGGIDFLVEGNGRGRRRSQLPHVPNAPTRQRTYPAEQRDPQHDGDIFTAGVMAATRMAQQMPLPMSPTESSIPSDYDDLPLSPRQRPIITQSRRTSVLDGGLPSRRDSTVALEIERLARDREIREQRALQEEIRREEEEDLALRLEGLRMVESAPRVRDPFAPFERRPRRESFGLGIPLERSDFPYRRDPLAARLNGNRRRSIYD